jgi:hypothetical protein
MTPEQLAARLTPGAIDALKLDLMRRIVLTVEGGIKRVTPVRTGNLRRSIHGEVQSAGERGVIGTNVVYARFVNNRRQFMERGLEDSLAAIDKIAEDAGVRFVAEVAG